MLAAFGLVLTLTWHPGADTAPDCRPHFSRIFVYVPSAISFLSAAFTGAVIPLFLGIAKPYGASS